MAFAALVLGFCLWLAPSIAAAHIIQSGAAGFGGGFILPHSGPDHFLAMFAVGLWGAQMGGRRTWTLPVTFPLIMVAGAIAGIYGLPLPGVEIGIALSIISLGLAIAFAWRPTELVVLTPFKKRPDELRLHDLIAEANNHELISAECRQLVDLAKDARDLIHPGKATRSGTACSKATALTALSAVYRIVEDIKSSAPP